MKAEFMTLWDGMNTSDKNRIVILGATNRPTDLDKAILRRMPKRFHITLPTLDQRTKVLVILLEKIRKAPNFNIEDIAIFTENYSNSDLKELCRNAVMAPVREALKTIPKDEAGGIAKIDPKSIRMRLVAMQDFLELVDASRTFVDPVD